MLRKCAVALSLALCCAGAFAEGEVASILEVTLPITKSDCEQIKRIIVIRQDRDREVIDTAKKVGDCTWRLATANFSVDRTHFSLRLPGVARTTCRLSKWNDTKRVAEVEFIPLLPVQQITITPTGPINLIYVRGIEVRRQGDVACGETGLLDEGMKPGMVIDVNLKVEKLRLPYLEGEKDDCGLSVNATLKNATTTGRSEIALSFDQIVAELARQKVVDAPCQPPNLSGMAIKISEINLKRKQLTGLAIGWK